MIEVTTSLNPVITQGILDIAEDLGRQQAEQDIARAQLIELVADLYAHPRVSQRILSDALYTYQFTLIETLKANLAELQAKFDSAPVSSDFGQALRNYYLNA